MSLFVPLIAGLVYINGAVCMLCMTPTKDTPKIDPELTSVKSLPREHNRRIYPN